jgi:hypothetical protein
MTTVRMQWIGTPVLGLCLLLQGCAVGSSDLQYHLASIQIPPVRSLTVPWCLSLWWTMC